MKLDKILSKIAGKKYQQLASIDEQIKYISTMAILLLVMIPLTVLGAMLIGQDNVRMILDFSLSAMCLIVVLLMRTKLPSKYISNVPVAIYGVYCLYLLYVGEKAGWPGAWALSFPILSIFLCGLTYGIITSSLVLVGLWVLLSSPWQFGFYQIGASYISTMYRVQDPVLSSRFITVYLLIFVVTIIYDRIVALKNQKEKELSKDLLYERNTIQTMKDNMNLGVFLMSKDLIIQTQYSEKLPVILSRYEDKLDGKNFLDLLSGSINTKQNNTLIKYFNMMFTKSRSLDVLAEANPLGEFEYKVDGRVKYLSTKFQLIEHENETSFILCVLEDITQQKELELELAEQQKMQQVEMKNLFEVVQIHPIIFEDFIDSVNDNFTQINNTLKDDSISERDIVTKFFQNIHAIKSNSLILGLETFGKKLHDFEEELKILLNDNSIEKEDIFHLTFELEKLMQEKDEYQKITEKLDQFKVIDVKGALEEQLRKAITKFSNDQNKKVTLDIKIDDGILETSLRKPIKDILLQFIRNSIYHGIEYTGKIVISLIKTADSITLNYSDNGRGLDFEKIKAKYLTIWPNTNPTQAQLQAAIFKPEFSTADNVSTIAGRGVGLSLVMDIIKENKGKIGMSTKNGLLFKIVFKLI